jgi:catechol 2,3-dioxygenase-like lactoylglutathione lyase family enzyme
MMQSNGTLVPAPIHHVGYAVPDMEVAVAHFVAALGVGPFLGYKDVKFDKVMSDGRPCTFDHSAAFTKWGDIFIELHEIHAASPEPVASVLRYGRDISVNHVSYISSDPAGDSARLEALGMPAVINLEIGPVRESIHRSPFGHSIEIQTPNEFIDYFFQRVAAASEGWDGAEPLRYLDDQPSRG